MSERLWVVEYNFGKESDGWRHLRAFKNKEVAESRIEENKLWDKANDDVCIYRVVEYVRKEEK